MTVSYQNQKASSLIQRIMFMWPILGIIGYKNSLKKASLSQNGVLRASEMANLMDPQGCQLIKMTTYMSRTRTITEYKYSLLTEHFLLNLAQKVADSVSLFCQKALELIWIQV